MVFYDSQKVNFRLIVSPLLQRHERKASQVIIVVDHVLNGTLLSKFYFRGSKWNRYFNFESRTNSILRQPFSVNFFTVHAWQTLIEDIVIVLESKIKY